MHFYIEEEEDEKMDGGLNNKKEMEGIRWKSLAQGGRWAYIYIHFLILLFSYERKKKR